ncbi:hypothetical protein HAX54_050106, partial [Datura stramonium]|nr:hypothetical protein [Datura stramonium]
PLPHRTFQNRVTSVASCVPLRREGSALHLPTRRNESVSHLPTRRNEAALHPPTRRICWRLTPVLAPDLLVPRASHGTGKATPRACHLAASALHCTHSRARILVPRAWNHVAQVPRCAFGRT